MSDRPARKSVRYIPVDGDMTAREARFILSVSPTQFWRLVYSFKLPHYHYSQKVIRFPADAVWKFKREREVRSAEDLRRMMDGRRNDNWGEGRDS